MENQVACNVMNASFDNYILEWASKKKKRERNMQPIWDDSKDSEDNE